METTRYITELHSRHPGGFTIDQAKVIIGDDCVPVIEILSEAGVIVDSDGIFEFTELAEEIISYDGNR